MWTRPLLVSPTEANDAVNVVEFARSRALCLSKFAFFFFSVFFLFSLPPFQFASYASTVWVVEGVEVQHVG